MATEGFLSDVSFRVLQDPRPTEKVESTNKPFATAEPLKEALIHLSHGSHLTRLGWLSWR